MEPWALFDHANTATTGIERLTEFETNRCLGSVERPNLEMPHIVAQFAENNGCPTECNAVYRPKRRQRLVGVRRHWSQDQHPYQLRLGHHLSLKKTSSTDGRMKI